MDERNSMIGGRTTYRVLMIKGTECDVCVHIEYIVWIEAERSYCWLHMKDGEYMLVSHPLGSILKRLQDEGYVEFVRINRSCAINLVYLQKKRGNCVYCGNQELVIGRVYRKEFMSLLIYP